MKSILILISFIFLTKNIFAQPVSPNKFKHQFGISAGFTNGVGISYRYWPGKLGIQATLLPIKTDENWTDIMGVQNFFMVDEFATPPGNFTSFGLTALIALKQDTKGKIFSYIGNHYMIIDHDEMYNVGAGFGFAVESRVSFNFMIGYAAYDVTNTVKLLPTTEIGLYFMF